MSLIKRSVILHKDSTKGVLTIIRIGDTLGAKLVLNEPIKKTLWAGLSLGDEPQQNYKVTAQVSELTPKCALGFNDSIGVVVLDEDGAIYAYGGVKEKVSLSLIKEAQKQDLLNASAGSSLQISPAEAKARADSDFADNAEITQAAAAEQKAVEAAAEAAVINTKKQDAPIEKIDTVQDNQQDIMQKQASKVPMDSAAPIQGQAAEGGESAQMQAAETAIPTQGQTAESGNPARRQASGSDNDKKQSRTAAGATQTTFSTGRGKEQQKKEEAPDKTGNDTQPQWVPTGEKKPINNPFNIPKAKNFYQSVRSRLEEIMTINPKESDLEIIIPDSDWVKVKYSGEEYYVVGRLYENNTVTYIGYGVPGIENVRPPKEAEELCDFLPLPDKQGVGYWLMFQKAEDGTMSRDI